MLCLMVQYIIKENWKTILLLCFFQTNKNITVIQSELSETIKKGESKLCLFICFLNAYRIIKTHLNPVEYFRTFQRAYIFFYYYFTKKNSLTSIGKR